MVIQRPVVLFVFASLGLLPGCSRVQLTKPDARPGEWERDNYECRREATYVGSSYGSAYRYGSGVSTYRSQSPETNWSLYYDCMAARGWRRTSATDAAEVRPVARASKSYQFTGTVVDVESQLMRIDKGGDVWEFSTAELNDVPARKGDRVTVHYWMVASPPGQSGVKLYHFTGTVTDVGQARKTLNVNKDGNGWEFATPHAVTAKPGDTLTVRYHLVARKIDRK